MSRPLAALTDHPDFPLLTVQEERTTDVRVYRPHTVQPPKPSIDWAALTPTCRSCGTKSGALNRDDQCPTCAAPPTQETPAPAPSKRPTRRSRRPARPQAPRPPRTPAPMGRPRLAIDTEAVAEAYTGGQTIPTIANALEVDRGRVRRALEEAHVQLRPDDTGRHRRRNQVDERAVLADYQAGASAPAIAERHGCTPKRVRSILDRHGVDRRDDRATRSGGRPRKYDAQVRAEVARLYTEERLSRAQVARKLHLPYKTVVTIMDRDGVPARQGETGHIDGAAALKQQMRDLGVDSADIKAWAFREGLVERIRRGIPAASLVAAYAQAHQQAGAA